MSKCLLWVVHQCKSRLFGIVSCHPTHLALYMHQLTAKPSHRRRRHRRCWVKVCALLGRLIQKKLNWLKRPWHKGFASSISTKNYHRVCNGVMCLSGLEQIKTLSHHICDWIYNNIELNRMNCIVAIILSTHHLMPLILLWRRRLIDHCRSLHATCSFPLFSGFHCGDGTRENDTVRDLCFRIDTGLAGAVPTFSCSRPMQVLRLNEQEIWDRNQPQSGRAINCQ